MTGLSISGEHRGERVGFEVVNRAKTVFNDPRNRKERELSREKRCDGDLVGGIKDRGRNATCAHGFAGEPQAGETRFVDRRKFQSKTLGEVDGGIYSRHTRRVQQSVLNRKRHGRWTKLSEQGAVVEFDEAVDDALGVEHSRALFRPKSKEPLSLDELEAFVSERRGVDRDFWTHRPIGMLKRVRRLHVRQAFDRPIPKRTATGG